MKIKLTSVSIEDYDKALKFYTEVLGFVTKRDIPLGGGARWITVVSPEEPDGTELLLEPNASYPAMKALKESLVKDGIPFTAFQVSDIQNEYFISLDSLRYHIKKMTSLLKVKIPVRKKRLTIRCLL